MEYVSKGWGFEQIIVNNEKYCGKILHFWKGKKCSWHFHRVKDETFYVSSGELEVTYGDSDNMLEAETIILKAGDSLHVPVGKRHQIKAIMETDMFEFSTHDKPEDSIKVIKGD
jgi:mannose-6-phosphate isomerase-like protein (cupin superfamily)